MDEPGKVTEAVNSYRAEQDSLGGFLADECIQDPTVRVKASRLYEAYRTHLQRLGKTPLSLTEFGLSISKLGYQKKENHGFWYLGIALRHSGTSDSDS